MRSSKSIQDATGIEMNTNLLLIKVYLLVDSIHLENSNRFELILNQIQIIIKKWLKSHKIMIKLLRLKTNQLKQWKKKIGTRKLVHNLPLALGGSILS